jgi:methionyl-tRNA formyltransferase
VAYGKIIPKEILDAPKFGFINVHTSLLPKYRGAAPIQWALINGGKETGVTVFKLKETLDTGDIILQKSIKIEDDDNTETLSVKLFDLGGKLLLEALDLIKNGKAEYKPQKEADASYAELLRKESGIIDWHKSAIEIHNRIRALTPWPGAYTYYNRKILKILKSEIKIVDLETKHKDPGIVVDIVKGLGFIVATGKGHILIKEVQPAGKKRMKAFDFCIGHKVKAEVVLPS